MKKAILNVGIAFLVVTLALTIEFFYRIHRIEHRVESLQVGVERVDWRSSQLLNSASRFMNESTQRQDQLRESVDILEAAAQKSR